jgi:hypothetical protein
MRIDEAFRRVIGGYWWLIGLLVVVPVVATGVYAKHLPPQYQAVARVQMSGGLASTNVQADAATQWLQGVITTPAMVRHAMTAAGIKGDPTLFATNSIGVTRVGVSTVNDVVVTTDNPDRSVIAANSLVQQALKYANTSHQSDASRMGALTQQIDALTKQRDDLIQRLAVAAPGPVLEIQARIAAMAPTLTDLLRQRSDLVLASAQRSSIGLLDPATTLPDPVGPKAPQLVALAGLAALILALGCVAILEAVHPQVRGRRWVAAELDVPLLGHLPTLDLTGPKGARSLREFGNAARVVGARFAGRPILLLPVEKRYERWAARVCLELETLTGVRIEHAPDAAAAPPGRATALNRANEPVVIALSPAVESQRNLEDVARNAAVMGWPVVGVLTFRRRRLLDLQTLAQGGRHARPPITPVSPTGPPSSEPDPLQPDRGASNHVAPDHGALSSQKMRGMQ